jgi:hypothetical protein
VITFGALGVEDVLLLDELAAETFASGDATLLVGRRKALAARKVGRLDALAAEVSDVRLDAGGRRREGNLQIHVDLSLESVELGLLWKVCQDRKTKKDKNQRRKPEIATIQI